MLGGMCAAMKILISGPGNYRNCIPEAFLHKIDECIRQEDELLVCDRNEVDKQVQQYLYNQMYDNVTVYISGRKGPYSYNIGPWREEYCPIGTGSGKYAYYIEQYFVMAEDADIGIIMWDGECEGAFINMINLINLGKTVHLYWVKEQRWEIVNSLEELKDYIGECSEWNSSDTEMILTKCGFSKEMKDHMMSGNSVNNFLLVDIICMAPVSLLDKLEMIQYLENTRNIKYEVCRAALRYNGDFHSLKKEIRRILKPEVESSIWNYLHNAYNDINSAAMALEFGGACDERYLYLYSEWYDMDVFEEKSSGVGMFMNMEDVIHYIRNEEQFYDSEEGWYRIEVWVNIEGDLSLKYNFYTYGGEVCWFEKMRPYNDEDTGNTYYRRSKSYYDSKCLLDRITTPFKTGDMICIDCRPFGPPFHAVILEDYHQYDSCFPNVLFNFPNTFEWSIESLKSGRFFRCMEGGRVIWCPLSALFRARLVEGDTELAEFSKKLSENPELATAIWEKWNHTSPDYKTVEMAREIFDIK